MTPEDLIQSLPPLGGVMREAWNEAYLVKPFNGKACDAAAALAVARVAVEHVLRELEKQECATAAVEAERQKEQKVPEGFGGKPERSQERADFEDWYVTHAFDYEASPLGSRDCALQWAAWMASGHYHARIPSQGAEAMTPDPVREALRSVVFEGLTGEGQLIPSEALRVKLVAAREVIASHPPAAAEPLTEEQIGKHALRAGDCPPDSIVLLVSAVKRLQTRHSAKAAQPAPHGWKLAQMSNERTPMRTIAERNLRSFLSKAAFSSGADRQAALTCVDVLAASPPPSAAPLTEAQIEAELALLPCPFCWHSDALVTYHDPQTVLHPWYRIDCDNCGAKGPGSDRGDHVEQWNARTPPPADAACSNFRLALNVKHPDCHKAADAFWDYWKANGETHKHGYYESTWGAINRAIRLVGVVPWDCGSAAKGDAPPADAAEMKRLADALELLPDDEYLIAWNGSDNGMALVKEAAALLRRMAGG